VTGKISDPVIGVCKGSPRRGCFDTKLIGRRWEAAATGKKGCRGKSATYKREKIGCWSRWRVEVLGVQKEEGRECLYVSKVEGVDKWGTSIGG